MRRRHQKFPFGAFVITLVVCMIVSAASGAGGAFFMFNLLYSAPETTTAQEYVIEATTAPAAVEQIATAAPFTEETTTENIIIETTTAEPVVMTEAPTTAPETTAETTAAETTAPPTTTLPETTTQAEKTTAAPMTAPPAETVTVYVPVTSPGSSLTKGDIYAEAVNSVVTIKTAWKQYYSSILGSYYRPATSSGTGFCISDNGYIVTNYHVIEQAEEVTVIDYNGKEYNAKIVGSEPSNDFAIIKIDAATVSAKIGSSSDMKVGDDIMVIGSALGELSYTFTDGIVSHLSRSVTVESGRTINMFQTNAAINNGNSGGPVYNMNGEVVGIASAKYASDKIEGLGFCIPIDDVKTMMSDIIIYGYVKGKPSLGISIQTVTASMASRYSVPTGCYLVAIEKDSPCYEAGIRSGDIITKLGNKTISSVEEIKSYLSKKQAGDKINITYYSAGETKTISVKIGEHKPSDPRTNYSNVYDV